MTLIFITDDEHKSKTSENGPHMANCCIQNQERKSGQSSSYQLLKDEELNADGGVTEPKKKKNLKLLLTAWHESKPNEVVDGNTMSFMHDWLKQMPLSKLPVITALSP